MNEVHIKEKALSKDFRAKEIDVLEKLDNEYEGNLDCFATHVEWFFDGGFKYNPSWWTTVFLVACSGIIVHIN